MSIKIVYTVISLIFVSVIFVGCEENQKNSINMKRPAEIKDTVEKKFEDTLDKGKAKLQTIKNLKDAVKGETNASAKYAAYSKKAIEEGFLNIAKLFEAISKSENVHANNHIAALEQLGEKPEEYTPKYDIKSTRENLNDAINGESYEVSSMYPEFIKTSIEGKVNMATISFNYAMKTEEKHKFLFENALSQLINEKENLISSEYYVCPTCGNTFEGQPPNRCNISMTPKERFIKM